MSYKQLTEIERYQIYRLKKMCFTQKIIAKEFGRSASTISRELSRNTGKKNYLSMTVCPLGKIPMT